MCLQHFYDREFVWPAFFFLSGRANRHTSDVNCARLFQISCPNNFQDFAVRTSR